MLEEEDFPGSRAVSVLVDAVVKPFKRLCADTAEETPIPVWDTSDEYDCTCPSRGMMIIINNEYFQTESSRPGSTIDANSIMKQFTDLGFSVACHHNKRKDEMMSILKKAAKADHTQSDCFACAILSHGDVVKIVDKKCPDRYEREDVVYATDKIILLNEIVGLFTDKNCKTLQGKPRLFFIQACRGNELDPGVSVNVIDGDELDSKKNEEIIEVTPCPLYKDCLIMYATPPGFFAFRRPDTGSWFIRALCEVMSRPEVRHQTLNRVLTSVIKLVSQEYESKSANQTISGRKQTPCFASMLLKDFYFRPKDMSTPV